MLSVCFCCKSVCLGKISDVAWEKMHFTWFSGRDGFSPTRHQILPSPLRGSGQDTVSSWEKTPSLLENHVKCISSDFWLWYWCVLPTIDLFCLCFQTTSRPSGHSSSECLSSESVGNRWVSGPHRHISGTV